MLSIDYFNILRKIETLFCSDKYIKYNSIDRIIELIYRKKDNIEYYYSIFINGDRDIDVIIPITNSNYKYRTKIQNLENVYYYLLYHLEKDI